MYELTIGNTDKLPVKLVDELLSTPVTGVQDAIVAYSKAGGPSTPADAGWEEIDAARMPGAYYLTLPPAAVDTPGLLLIGVTAEGCAPVLLVIDVKPQRFAGPGGSGAWPWTPTVKDGDVPIADVEVTVYRRADDALVAGPLYTNGAGECRDSTGAPAFRLDAGEYRVRFSKIGINAAYFDFTIEPDGTESRP